MILVDDYRIVLLEEMNRRKDRNPSYSARAFARDIGLSPQMLNRVFRSHCGISASVASDIAKRLELNDHDQELFVALVESKHARSSGRRATAMNSVLRLRAQEQVNIVPYDYGKTDVMTHWAAAVLIDQTNFRSDYAWIAQQLDLSEEEARQCFDNLICQGWVERDERGNFKATKLREQQGVCFYYPDQVARREFSLDRRIAYEAMVVSNEDGPRRPFETMMIAVNKEDLDKMTSEIESAFKKIYEEYAARSETRDTVVALNFALMPINERKSS